MDKYLKIILDDIYDYGQSLQLFCDGLLIFHGVADDLITSVSGELQFRLNFGGSHFFLHSLRGSNGFISLTPNIFDVYELQKSRKYQPLICSLNDLTDLWRQLRYDPKELSEILSVTSSDLFLLWLIASKYPFVQPLELTYMGKIIADNIVAESPDNRIPSIKETIQDIIGGEIYLEGLEVVQSANSNVITAYVSSPYDSTVEWDAISSDRRYCLINKSIVSKIIP